MGEGKRLFNFEIKKIKLMKSLKDFIDEEFKWFPLTERQEKALSISLERFGDYIKDNPVTIIDEVGNRKTIYATAGELVKLITIMQEVAICENSKGERFSTRIENLKKDLQNTLF